MEECVKYPPLPQYTGSKCMVTAVTVVPVHIIWSDLHLRGAILKLITKIYIDEPRSSVSELFLRMPWLQHLVTRLMWCCSCGNKHSYTPLVC